MFKISEQPNHLLEAGTWVDYQGARFLVAHAGNSKFQRTMARLQKPFRRKLERNEMDPADQKRILIQALGEAILLGWDGVKDASENDVPFSRDMAVKALSNDEGFREFVMETSMDMENFKLEEAEHEGKS